MQTKSNLSWILGASFFVLSIAQAHAANVSISGGAFPASGPGSFPGYSTGTNNQSNVVNNGSAVYDPSSVGANYKASTSTIEAIVKYVGSAPSYTVDWYYIGSESGYLNTFHASGDISGNVSQPDTDNGNSTAINTPLTLANLYIGTTVGSAPIIDFGVTASSGASLNNGGGNPDPATSHYGLAFAFLGDLVQQNPTDPLWTIVSYPTDTFLVAWNDSGSDDNHDDITIVGKLSVVPLPGALPLFGTGLGLLGFLSRKRRKHMTQAPA